MKTSRVLLVSNSGENGFSKTVENILIDEFKCSIEHVDLAGLEAQEKENYNLVLFMGMAENGFTIGDSISGVNSPKILILFDEAQVQASLMNDFDDILILPAHDKEIMFRISKALRKNEFATIKKNLLQELGIRGIIGRDPAFLDAVQKIPKVSASDASILIHGETGSGKSVFSNAIHYLSDRSKKPFFPVECGSIPNHLLENDLFGHSKGAFTDAKVNKMGIVSQADGGTLFLDEIDTLDLEAQGKILHLIEDKRFRPIGHSKIFEADVRIIAATNRDLNQLVKEGKFRQDLYYRLNVKLRIPPLRERRTDITLLANYFVQKQNNQLQHGKKWLSNAALNKLVSYDWPGNIRELENVIQQAFLFSESEILNAKDLEIQTAIEEGHVFSFTDAKRIAIETFEKEYLRNMLLMHNGNITTAAREAKKDRRDFGRLVKKYNIETEQFKESAVFV